MNLGRMLIGLLVTLLGVLFLLDSLGVIDDAGDTIGAAWPVALVAVGAVQLVERRRLASGPLILIGVGLLLLGTTTGIARLDWSLLWPIAVVAVGISLLVRRGGPEGEPAAGGEGRLQVTALLGSRSLRPGREFDGGSLTALLGGVEVDLRDAALPEDGATLEVTAIMGGVTLMVPETWTVDERVMAILGGFDDSRRRRPATTGAPTLTITGLVLLGGGEIKD